MAEFAGYDMPIQYPTGVLTEHNWTREKCGLFDVSHMGQIVVEGSGAADLWEKLTPSSIATLGENVAKYTVLTNENGGIIDDLIITRLAADRFFAVINAGCKDKDIGWIEQNLPHDTKLTILTDRALLALQGPSAENVLRETLGIDTANLGYMRLMAADGLHISRLGYTGEDGFEVSIPYANAATIWEKFLQHSDVKPIGLAARDSLRLEMGYPLYGHDIDAATTPIEADLGWIIGKAKGEYLGEAVIEQQRQKMPTRKRVGIRLTGKGVAREGAEIFAKNGDRVGVVTSGGFSPTLNLAIGQAYIDPARAGDEILVRVRERDIEAIIVAMPFVAPKTKTMQKSKAA